MNDGAGSPAHDLPVAPAGLQPGQVIDGFRLEERLHVGGMAVLWGVTRCVEGPSAAAGDEPALIMKVPRIKGGEDPASIVGFEVERMIMPTLGGPHVPRFFAKGDFTRQPHIVMERIPGASLKARFDESPLAFDEVTEIGARVAAALHDLHRQHVIHRDVKPSNVLMRPSGEAVLVDFGLARHDQLPDLLAEEFVLPLGTGPYMSPEQVQYVRSDPRSDIFALGVMLYHFTTGQRPFGAPTSVSGLRRRLYVEPIPPRAVRQDCPRWLQEIILRCLEVDPSKRYATAAQLALALHAPDQVPLTHRADKLARSGALTTLKRWFFALGSEPDERADLEGAHRNVDRNPLILAAVDTEHGAGALLEQLRETVRRVLLSEPGARLACVSVMRTARVGMDELVDAQGRSLHVKQLVALKHWGQPIRRELRLDEGRITYHVLEAPDPASALVDFASRNKVDHIVMGARGQSTFRRYLGSVSSQVVAQSDCTVTVVRAAASSQLKSSETAGARESVPGERGATNGSAWS